jgi:hypothetical protein
MEEKPLDQCHVKDKKYTATDLSKLPLAAPNANMCCSIRQSFTAMVEIPGSQFHRAREYGHWIPGIYVLI